MTPTDANLNEYQDVGHITYPELLNRARSDALLEDSRLWGDEFIADLDAEQRQWYIDGGANGGGYLRKLDNAVFHRAAFRELASTPELVKMVEQLIGPGVTVAFSQVFFKPPDGGGPKPAHQDNFYFGSSDPDGMVTAWVALDTATIENGCLFFADGSNKGPILEHIAPADEPFNLQIPEPVLNTMELTPAPVPKGGVSFHHGNTVHQ